MEGASNFRFSSGDLRFAAEDALKVDADEDGIGGDDAADAMRYLVATKARAITRRKLSAYEQSARASTGGALTELNAVGNSQ
jgi:hypothetical protein